MRYITRKDSETGKKFMAAYDNMKNAEKEARELVTLLGAKQWRERYGVAAGGVAALVFDKKPDTKIWKNVYGSSKNWMPKLNCTEGKRINSLIENLPVVWRNELNQCIGFDGFPSKNIGFDIGKGEYVGFSVEEEWDVKVPADCEEVTTYRYNEAIGKEASND